MMQKGLFCIALCLVLLLSACGTPPSSGNVPSIQGNWKDDNALVQACGGTGSLGLSLKLKQVQGETHLTGDATLLANGEFFGTFEGSVKSSGDITGTARFETSDGYFYLDGTLKYANTQIKGKFTDRDRVECNAGGTDKIVIDVTLINTNKPPVANAGEDQKVLTGSKVTLDASKSSDPDNDKLTYKWEWVSKPNSSNAQLAKADSVSGEFTTDLAGIYTVKLSVSDGNMTNSDTVTIVVSNDPPVAAAGVDQTIALNTVSVLNGTSSYDPENQLLTYTWVLTSKPTGSIAVLDSQTSAQPKFTADLEGDYTFTLTVNDGTKDSQTDTVTLSAHPVALGTIHLLDFNVIDAEYSKGLDKIIIVSSEPNQLHIYDPILQSVKSVNLSYVPTSVSVGPNGRYAAVGHDAYISYVDLVATKLEKTLLVSTDVLDVVLAGNGFVYAFPKRDQWTSIYSIDVHTGEEFKGGNFIYAGTVAKLHPGGNAMYGANRGLSPSDIEKYDISNGPVEGIYDSPYHGDYEMCGDLWMSEDGLRIFTACGNIFRASENKAQDMVYNGSFKSVTTIRHLSHNLIANKVAVVPGDYYYNDMPTASEVFLYNYDPLSYFNRLRLPKLNVEGVDYDTFGEFVFFSNGGGTYYVIVQVDADAGLTNNQGIIVYKP